MTLQLTLRDIAEAKGLDLGRTQWRTIDQARIDGFAEHTNDKQWIHVDPERAASGPFHGTIAHGYLTLSLVPSFLVELVTITDLERGVNYGLEKVRFTAPVPVGSQVRLKAAIDHAQRRDDGGVQYTVSFSLECQGQDRPALVGQSVYLGYPA